MTTRASWLWLVEIEGLGRGGTVYFGPMALTTEPDPGEGAFAGAASGRSTDEWQNVLQPGLTLSGMTYSPIGAAPAAQTLSFSLAMPDDRPEIEAFFLTDNPRPVAVLTADATVTDDVFTVNDTSELAIFDVVYIGAEAFRVTSIVSGTTFRVADSIPKGLTWPDSIDANTENRTTDGAVGRIGAIGSRMADHPVPGADEAPPWPDNRVYLQNPRVKGRRVYLRRVSWGADPDGDLGYREQLFGVFVITGWQVGSDGTTVSVTATSSVTSYAKRQLGAKGVKDRVAAFGWASGRTQLGVFFDPAPDAQSRRIWKRGTVAVPSGAAVVYRAFWSASGTVYASVGAEDGEVDYYNYIMGAHRLGGKAPTIQTAGGTLRTMTDVQTAFAGNELKLEAAEEVLTSDPLDTNLSASESSYPFNPETHPYYSPDKPGGAGVLQHPLHLMLAHLGQLQTNLPDHWQLRLSSEEVDTAGILALAAGPMAIVQTWPGVCVVGPVKDALKWLAETFLAPIACGWVTDEYGRLSVAALIAPRLGPWSAPAVGLGSSDVSVITTAYAMPGRGIEFSPDVTAGTVQADTGYGIGKTAAFTVYSDDAYRVPDGDPDDSVLILQAMGAMSPDIQTLGAATPDLVPGLRIITSTIGTFMRRGFRRYVLDIPSGFLDEELQYQSTPTLGPAMPSRYALPGSLVTVQLPGLRGTSDELRTCVVMAHQWSDNCTRQTIAVMDLGTPRRVAFACRVVSAAEVDGSLEVVVETDVTTTPHPYEAVPFGSITEDGQTAAAFSDTAGDFEFARWADSTLAIVHATPDIVTNYDPATNTLTCGYSGFTPIAGDWALLANRGESDVDEFFAFMGRDRYTL